VPGIIAPQELLFKFRSLLLDFRTGIFRKIVSPLSALSVTDTDTGFSSSSPWLEIADDNMLDQSKQQSIKDSAYQTKQSSIERNPLEVPNNSYENPEDGA
jgi:hypothetical protein